jgi:hypothetical protein
VADAEKQGLQYFDRYEIVAVSLPGAALLMAAGLLSHDVAQLTPKDISVGSLGLFGIASLIAGHLIQAIAHTLEKIWESRSFSSNHAVSETLQADVIRLLEKPAAYFSGGTLAYRDWRAVRAQVLAKLRAADRSKLVDTLKVNSGLNRGLSVVGVMIAIGVAIRLLVGVVRDSPPEPGPIAIGCIALLAAYLFFKRYEQYETDREAQVWIQFVAAGAALTGGYGAVPTEASAAAKSV